MFLGQSVYVLGSLHLRSGEEKQNQAPQSLKAGDRLRFISCGRREPLLLGRFSLEGRERRGYLQASDNSGILPVLRAVLGRMALCASQTLRSQHRQQAPQGFCRSRFKYSATSESSQVLGIGGMNPHVLSSL
jgi:hypothetical protein